MSIFEFDSHFTIIGQRSFNFGIIFIFETIIK